MYLNTQKSADSFHNVFSNLRLNGVAVKLSEFREDFLLYQQTGEKGYLFIIDKSAFCSVLSGRAFGGNGRICAFPSNGGQTSDK